MNYWIRYWHPSMNTDETLENLDFDPGMIYEGSKNYVIDYKKDAYVAAFYGPDLWYASKCVGLCLITQEEDRPDIHVWVDPDHENKGIGLAIIYKALQNLPDGHTLDTIATPRGAKALTEFFGFDYSDESISPEECSSVSKYWNPVSKWLDGIRPAFASFLEKTLLAA